MLLLLVELLVQETDFGVQLLLEVLLLETLPVQLVDDVLELLDLADETPKLLLLLAFLLVLVHLHASGGVVVLVQGCVEVDDLLSEELALLEEGGDQVLVGLVIILY